MILATALVIAACGSSGGHTSTHSASKTHSTTASASPVQSGHAEIAIHNFAFAPARITVTAGTRVTWTNHDETAHTATANNNSFDTGTIEPKASRTIDFKRPGVYHYHCSFHAFMTGTVIVKP